MWLKEPESFTKTKLRSDCLKFKPRLITVLIFTLGENTCFVLSIVRFAIKRKLNPVPQWPGDLYPKAKLPNFKCPGEPLEKRNLLLLVLQSCKSWLELLKQVLLGELNNVQVLEGLESSQDFYNLLGRRGSTACKEACLPITAILHLLRFLLVLFWRALQSLEFQRLVR